MELAKVRKLSAAELTKEITKTTTLIVQLKSEVAMHRVKNWRSLSQAKKYLARLLTVKRQQEIIKIMNNE